MKAEIEKICLYCEHAAPLDDDYMKCDKKGKVLCVGKCFRFSYDPLKRVPKAPKKLTENDFPQI